MRFTDEVDLAKQILQQRQIAQVPVPKLHWCGHYLNPDDKSQVIPDGASCCWWHYIGLPRRYGVRHPAYPWQEDVFKEYFEDHQKYFYFGKVPKQGATQTWIGIGLHEALENPNWANGQVAFVVGTHGKEAEKTIERCKEMIAYKDKDGKPIFDKKGNMIMRFKIDQEYNNVTEFTINSVEFRAHPAKNIDSIRSQPNMRMIIVDELAFFEMIEQQKVRDAFEHYIGNSDVIIVLITTAGDSPQGVAYDIETEQPTIYKRHLYDYNIGLVVHPESMTSLFKKADIDLIRSSKSFRRNYLRHWGVGSGNIFELAAIEQISVDKYDLKPQSDDVITCVDPGYGSSSFAVSVYEKRDGIVYVLYASQFTRASQTEMIDKVKSINEKYHSHTTVIDSNNPGFIAEFTNSKPKSFRELGEIMTDNAASMVSKHKVRIHPDFEDLILQLKSVQKNDKGTPDKKRLNYDLGDTFHMGLHEFSHSITGAILRSDW